MKPLRNNRTGERLPGTGRIDLEQKNLPQDRSCWQPAQLNRIEPAPRWKHQKPRAGATVPALFRDLRYGIRGTTWAMTETTRPPLPFLHIKFRGRVFCFCEDKSSDLPPSGNIYKCTRPHPRLDTELQPSRSKRRNPFHPKGHASDPLEPEEKLRDVCGMAWPLGMREKALQKAGYVWRTGLA